MLAEGEHYYVAIAGDHSLPTSGKPPFTCRTKGIELTKRMNTFNCDGNSDVN
jgi:hypothetical protein